MSHDATSLTANPEAHPQRLYRMVAHLGYPDGTFEELRFVARAINQKAAQSIFDGCLEAAAIEVVRSTLVVSEVKP